MTDPIDEGPDAASLTLPPTEKPTPTVGRSSAILAAGTLVSRILGFISAGVLARAIGIIGAGADTFTLANQLPSNIYALVAGGLLSAVLVPQIVRAGLDDDGGARFVNRLVTLGLTVFLLVTVAATLSAPLLVSLYAQGGAAGGFSDREFALAISFAYWCLPQVFFYAVYSLLGEVLNARGVFGPTTWIPALNNVVVIIGLTVFTAVYGGDPAHRDAASWTGGQVALLAGSATLGIATQALGLFFFWRRAGLTYRPDFRWRGVGLGRTGRAAAWVFGMFLVTQVSGVVESRVATLASGEASLAVLKYGWLMFMLPHSIVTVSIVTAYFTRMSGHARDGRLDGVRTDLASALRSILLLMVFAAVGLSVLAYPFSAVFGGNYAGVVSLASVYLAFLAGLLPFTVFFVLLRVYYAIDDTRTPFFIQVVQTAFYVSCALLVGAIVPKEWIAVGLAASLALAITLQAVLSAIFLRRRIGGLETGAVALQAVWFLGAAVVAAGAGAGVIAALGGWSKGAFPVDSAFGGIVTMLLAGSTMAVVYAGVLWVTRNPGLRAAADPLVARLRRRP